MKPVNTRVFAETLAKSLTKMQDILIEYRRTGRCDNQSIVPVLNITDGELRRISRRERIKKGFIANLTNELEDLGIDVDYDEATGLLVLRKPAQDIQSTFDSLQALNSAVEKYTLKEQRSFEGAHWSLSSHP